MTGPQDHARTIRAATAVLYRKLDAEGRPRAIGKHLEAIDNAAAALQAERDEALAALKEAEDRGDRFFRALQRAIPGHYDHVLWFHYTVERPSILDKRDAWRQSDKCKVGPFDMEHWFRVFGLEDGDWVKADPDAGDDTP